MEHREERREREEGDFVKVGEREGVGKWGEGGGGV